MKKIFVMASVVLCLALIFCSCANNMIIKKGERVDGIDKRCERYFTITSLSGYKTDGGYCVVVENNGIVQGVAMFSSERRYCESQGIDLIDDSEGIEKYLNKPFEEIRQQLGAPHADVGSGFYIPAYLTEKAYLICFELEDGIVCGIVKKDMIKNEIAERVER